jgi:hypothetical protein
MAAFLFLVAAIGGVVVADLVLENPTGGQATVFTQPVSGHSQGALLALAAALGFVTALLLVASLGWTRRQWARRRQPRAISANGHRQAAAAHGEQPGLLEEWFGRHVTVAELSQPAPPTDQNGWEDQPQDRASTVLPGPSQHQPGSFHQRTRRAAHLRNHSDGWLPPNNQPPR